MIPKIIHETWHTCLEHLFKDSKITQLRDDILLHEKFFPEKKDIFRVFEMPLNKIRVVVLGQDPYPRVGQANGLAFAVNEGVPLPTSLRVLNHEVEVEHHNDNLPVIEGLPYWGTLEHWHRQGVFLLNTALTVREGEAGSHISYWQWFTKEVVRIISIQGENPVWMLWGSKAKGYTGFIHGYYKWNKVYKGNFNYVLTADHPASGSHGDKYNFAGCGHFKTCNEILSYKNQKPIYW